jgi:WD40 repeat protein
MYEVQTGALRHRLLGRAGAVTSVSLSADGKTIAAGFCNGGGIQLWNVATGLELGVFDEGHSFYQVAFSPDGRYLASVEWDGNGAHDAEIAVRRAMDASEIEPP